ncbi:hypothetical protein COP1_040446 [Malus domestica]
MKKDEANRYELVAPAMPKIASTIANRIAQHRGFVVPPMSKSMLRRPLGAKSGSPLKRLATMKSDKVDSTAKVAPRPIPLAAKTSSPTEKEETTQVDSCEKSTKPVFGKVAKIYALLKPDLLEDMDVCAKLVDSVRGVICPSSFVKHSTQYRNTALLAMIQKMAIMAAESTFLDQEDTKAVNKVQRLSKLKHILLSRR